MTLLASNAGVAGDPIPLVIHSAGHPLQTALAALVSEMLDGVAPLFVEQMRLLQAVADQPQKARELVTEFGMQGINTISQQLLDLPPVRPKRGRPRKHATP